MVLSLDALNKKEGESWVYKGHQLYKPRDHSAPTRTLMHLSRGGADAEGDEEIVEGTGRARVRDRSRSPHRTPEISAALACKYRKVKLQNKLTPEKIAFLDHYESKARKSKYSRAQPIKGIMRKDGTLRCEMRGVAMRRR